MRIVRYSLAGLLALVAAAAEPSLPPLPQIGPTLPPPPPAVVDVHVDHAKVVMTSLLRVGVTETHESADHWDAKPAAAARGVALTRGVAQLQNTHIQAFGVGVIEPKPGVWDWKSMDKRIAWMRDQKIPIVITLCTAPGWMKTTGGDWDMGSSIKPEHNKDFAELCVAVAKRYPDVRYFQVWNEFKGYWDKSKNTWDVAGYTAMYNVVYDALKKHDATLKVGGFYLPIAGDGAKAFGFSGQNTFMPMADNEKALLRYWTANRHGADFVCADKGIPDYHDKNTYDDDVLMALTPQYEKVTRELHDLSGGLPVWWSEFYSFGRDGRTDLTGASYASAYVHALLGGASTALVWNPNGGELDCYLYTDVRKPDGGVATEHYVAFKAIAEHFRPGTEIVATTTTSPWVEALASKTSTLLINKWHAPVTLSLDGKLIDLKAYAVQLVE